MLFEVIVAMLLEQLWLLEFDFPDVLGYNGNVIVSFSFWEGLSVFFLKLTRLSVLKVKN